MGIWHNAWASTLLTALCLPAAMGLLQERASLKQSQLPAFLSRQLPLEQMLGPGSKKLELMGQIQDFMTDTRQVRAGLLFPSLPCWPSGNLAAWCADRHL
jgi:hypothetical protein